MKHLVLHTFRHNNWANDQILSACIALRDEQLDAEPGSATRGSIRKTLDHLVGSQAGYLALLTGLDRPATGPDRPALSELRESVQSSGEGLVALIEGSALDGGEPLKTPDGYLVDRWVVLLQAINHASEHREQIKGMLTEQGVRPPDVDGWAYGESVEALVQLPE